MDAKTNDEIRRRLQARRAELTNEGDHDIEPLRDSDDPTRKIDEDAAPLSEMNQVIASNRNRTRTHMLTQIAAALTRLKEDPDDFGLCESCEEPIPLRRLELMPWATHCIGCQSQHEADERSMGRRKNLTDYR